MRARFGLYVLLSCVFACGDDGDARAEGTTGVEGTTGTEGDGSSTSGSANDLPTMEAEVDVAAACGQADAMTISFVATRVACAKPPPSPCTLPDPPSSFTGTVIDCPANDVSAALRVGVNQTGRYHVETVLALEDGSELRECYAEGDSIEVIIDDGRLANRPTIEVASMGGPCDG